MTQTSPRIIILCGRAMGKSALAELWRKAEQTMKEKMQEKIIFT